MVRDVSGGLGPDCAGCVTGRRRPGHAVYASGSVVCHSEDAVKLHRTACDLGEVIGLAVNRFLDVQRIQREKVNAHGCEES